MIKNPAAWFTSIGQRNLALAVMTLMVGAISLLFTELRAIQAAQLQQAIHHQEQLTRCQHEAATAIAACEARYNEDLKALKDELLRHIIKNAKQ